MRDSATEDYELEDGWMLPRGTGTTISEAYVQSLIGIRRSDLDFVLDCTTISFSAGAT